ncbi:MAG: hypothetical protein RLZZ74_1946 [Cyanobacteriota bacterium]|jgi:hypothetical protein
MTCNGGDLAQELSCTQQQDFWRSPSRYSNNLPSVYHSSLTDAVEQENLRVGRSQLADLGQYKYRDRLSHDAVKLFASFG